MRSRTRLKVPKGYGHNRTNIICISQCGRCVEGALQPEEKSCSVVWWCGCRYLCIFWQIAAGWTNCSLTLTSVQPPHLNNSALWMDTHDVPGSFVFAFCRDFLSNAVHEPCQFGMFPGRMFSIAHLQKFNRNSPRTFWLNLLNILVTFMSTQWATLSQLAGVS